MKSEQLKREFAEDMLQIVNDYSCAADDKETFIRRCNAQVEFVIAERMINNSEVRQYFYNHFDCHTDVEIGNTIKHEVAMTYQAVLKMFKWFRSRMEGSEK